ncbi:MAG: hypothetical protein J6C25_04270 [Treponema sp.]|nr:hypothetical protein [Treponema sp.]
MFKKFALWFICFGLSFLVESWGWTEQGKAFMYINLGTSILIVLIVLAILVIAGIADGCAAEANGISFLAILVTIGALAITLFATWGATKLFNVDFYVAYQIMTFGQCLCTSNKKKDD